ncbi:hypothetical protein G6321_00024280 [Bradyrhizobium barranii subsp. barranii]|uniref:Uncharacterized protein n=1 Tax=Bradyrhizobium barranii subsp. barranii TaxID=2823807 RepID=A0A9X9Z7H3_9BRAD|nr:hypothetical protein [Bradyrhizobium barranii]UGX99128.1 hypothetical protein G6321_00024280 [Bradyrhizobium barranii subsp. barranii]
MAGVLAAMWAWTGVIYHLIFFAPINTMIKATICAGQIALL